MNPSSLHKDWSGKNTKPSRFTRASKATFTQCVCYLWQHQSSSASQKWHSSMGTEETQGELSGKVTLPMSSEVWRELFPKQRLDFWIRSTRHSALSKAGSQELSAATLLRWGKWTYWKGSCDWSHDLLSTVYRQELCTKVELRNEI